MSFPSTANSGAPRRLAPSRRNDVAALAVLILIPLALLGPCLVGGQTLAPAQQLQHFRVWRDASQSPPPWDVMMWDDLAQLLPWQAEARRSVLQNRVPLWNAEEACGTPLLANSQTSGLSPLWLLFQTMGVAHAQARLAWFQLALAGAGMYGFLRHFKLQAIPALFGALTYELSGWSLAWIEFPNRHGPVAWLPLTLLLLAKSIHGGWRWRMGCAAAVAVSVLSSHLQFEFYLFLGLALGAAMLYPPGRRAENRAEGEQAEGLGDRTAGNSPSGAWRWIAAFGLIVLLAVLLAAPQLLPSIELGKHSYRLAQVSWSAYQERMSFALPAWRLAQAFVPGFFGYPSLGTVLSFLLPGTPPVVHFSADFYEFCLFTGTAPLFLAINGIRGCRQSGLARFLTALGIISLLLATGTLLNAPLYFLIPGFSAMAGSARMLYLFAFSVAGLAAVGLDRWGRGYTPPGGGSESPLRSHESQYEPAVEPPPASARRKLLPLIDLAIVLSLGIACCCGAAVFLSQHAGSAGSPDAGTMLSDRALLYLAPILILAVTAGCMMAMERPGAHRPGAHRPGLRPALQILILVVTVVQLLAFGRTAVQTAPAASVFPETDLIRAIKSARPFRTMSVGRDWTLDRSPDELPSPPALPPNTGVYYGLSSLEGYDSLNSRPYIDYVARLEGTGAAPVPTQNGNMVLLSNGGSPLVAKAGVTLVASVSPQSSSRLAAAGGADGILLYRVRDARRPAYVVRPDGGESRARVVEWSGGRIVLTGAVGPGQLIVLDAAAPGWQANVDGVVVPVGTADGLFKSITLGEGSHNVTIEYRPLSYRLGVFLSAFVCGGIAGVLAWGKCPGIRPRRDGREVRRARRELT